MPEPGAEPIVGVSLARRLTWVTLGRLALLSALLGILAWLYLRVDAAPSFTPKLSLFTLAAAYALAGGYAAVLRSGKHLVLLAHAQLVLDQIAWTVVAYLSGGAMSGATSLYGLTCLAGASLTGFRGATVAAVAAAASYSVLALGQLRGWLPIPPDQPAEAYVADPMELGFHATVNALAVVVVTQLAGYLAERLRAAGGQVARAEARATEAERLAALGSLAAGLAHEIRNPLGSITASVGLLKSAHALGDEDRQLCDIIQREAARLEDLVEDMMDLARPRKPDPRPVDVGALARDVVALASRSGRGGEDVGVTYDGVEVGLIEADAAQLRQLVWNLVRNAVQASHAGGEVRVRLLGEGGALTLDVEDDGVGIDPADRARLFDAFFTTRSKGTGVGLAVVKRIADDHGFRIEVDSERGHGARFRVRLGPELRPAADPGIPASGGE
ncbi:MAG: ATP-binding protein [Polyangiaceae bacterium]|nr:ATP-binding protein [Polyangiaceae bacterium]